MSCQNFKFWFLTRIGIDHDIQVKINLCIYRVWELSNISEFIWLNLLSSQTEYSSIECLTGFLKVSLLLVEPEVRQVSWWSFQGNFQYILVSPYWELMPFTIKGKRRRMLWLCRDGLICIKENLLYLSWGMVLNFFMEFIQNLRGKK
jgi:hypothetical protein